MQKGTLFASFLLFCPRPHPTFTHNCLLSAHAFPSCARQKEGTNQITPKQPTRASAESRLAAMALAFKTTWTAQSQWHEVDTPVSYLKGLINWCDSARDTFYFDQRLEGVVGKTLQGAFHGGVVGKRAGRERAHLWCCCTLVVFIMLLNFLLLRECRPALGITDGCSRDDCRPRAPPEGRDGPHRAQHARVRDDVAVACRCPQL